MNISITLEVTGYPPGRSPPALETAGGGPVDNPAAYHMHTHPSPTSFRLIPELELTAVSSVCELSNDVADE
jgi:hypothetical protein